MFAVGSLAVILICMIGIPGGLAHAQIDGSVSATAPPFAILHHFDPGSIDGYSPFGSFTLSGATLYGMTTSGGDTVWGTIFKFDTKTKTLTILHSFAGGTNGGASPYGSLTLLGTTLYGTTSAGGAHGGGTIFSLPSVPLSMISGAVTENTSTGPVPVPGVTVTLSQPHWTLPTTTDTSGNYAFPDLVPGNYTVTPGLTGYAFAPKSTSVRVNGSDLTESFTGGPVTISGMVKFNGAPVTTNLMMNLSGKASGTYTPDASGYIFSPLVNGTYKVTPTFTFTHPAPAPKATPPSATIVINGKRVKENFTYKTNATCFNKTLGCHQ